MLTREKIDSIGRDVALVLTDCRLGMASRLKEVCDQAALLAEMARLAGDDDGRGVPSWTCGLHFPELLAEARKRLKEQT